MRDGMGLGEREAAIMAALWRADGPLSVREVLDRMDSEPAYTTVMTVLDNLFGKGMVTRHKVGRAFHYQAANSREELAARMLHEVLHASGDAERVLLHFARTSSDEDAKLIRRAFNRRNKP